MTDKPENTRITIVGPNKYIGKHLRMILHGSDATRQHRDQPDCSRSAQNEGEAETASLNAGSKLLHRIASQVRKSV